MDQLSLLKLSKKLSWLLRHSSVNSHKSLQRFSNGYFLFSQVVKFIRDWTEEEVRICVNSSVSPSSGENRFELKTVGDTEYIRATYGHSFPLTIGKSIGDSPKVPSLVDLCFLEIIASLKRFDSFYGLLDNDLLGRYIQTLKEKGKVTGKSLALALVPQLTTLDLSNTFVSDSVLRTACKQCLQLTALNLTGAYSTLNDANLAMLAKNLTKLEELNLKACNRITDNGIKSVMKLQGLKYLNLSECPLITDASLNLLAEHPTLEALDVRKVSTFTTEGINNFSSCKPSALLSSINTPLFYDYPEPFSTLAEGFEFTLKDKVWPTSHHYFQAMKFEGTPYEEEIRLAPTGKQAQVLGRAPGHEPRPGWDDMRVEVWIEGNLAKFRQHRKIRQLLLETGDRQLHWNRGNEFWGGRHPHCQNQCGKGLMTIRGLLREEEAERARVVALNEENLRRTRNGAILRMEEFDE